jgi:hypothetical protein
MTLCKGISEKLSLISNVILAILSVCQGKKKLSSEENKVTGIP